MDLKQVFIKNLKKFRKKSGLSQMKLAELCNTAPNYIGEIEIRRRFPSLKLIEKMGLVLKVEPFRFFIDNTSETQNELEEAIQLIAKLPDEQRLKIINEISSAKTQAPA